MKKLLLGTALAALAFSAPAFASVVNGGFESGDSGFSSDYASVTDCHPAASYDVVANPNDCHPSWVSYGPHGGSLQMAVNGAGDSTLRVWFETLGVATGTIYDFTAWARSSFPDSPANLLFEINGGSIGTLLLTSDTSVWTMFSGTWNSGANTTATLAIYDLNTEPFGNDFTLDDISFERVGPAQAPEPMTLTLFGGGLAGLGALRRRRKANS